MSDFDYADVPTKAGRDAERWLLEGDGLTTARFLAKGGSVFRVAQDMWTYNELGYNTDDIERLYLAPVLKAIQELP